MNRWEQKCASSAILVRDFRPSATAIRIQIHMCVTSTAIESLLVEKSTESFKSIGER